MEPSSREYGKPAVNGADAGVLTRDSKIGNLVNAGVTAVGLVLVEWLSELDFSDAPSIIATMAPPAVGLIVGLITSKVLPRYKRR